MGRWVRGQVWLWLTLNMPQPQLLLSVPIPLLLHENNYTWLWSRLIPNKSITKSQNDEFEYVPTVASVSTGFKCLRQSTRLMIAKCSARFSSFFAFAAAFKPAAQIAPYMLVFALVHACTGTKLLQHSHDKLIKEAKYSPKDIPVIHPKSYTSLLFTIGLPHHDLVTKVACSIIPQVHRLQRNLTCKRACVWL